jgi:hypothetical protein
MGHKDQYLVEDIDMPSPCSLVMRNDINNIHTREVAMSFAIPGCQYHGCDILEDYYRVEVSTIIQGYEDNMLEIQGYKQLSH